MAVNAQELQGQWNQLRGKVKEKWGQLTDDDLAFHGGNADQLIGKIQQRTGEGREAIEKFFGELTSKGGSVVAQATEAASNFAQNAAQQFRDKYGDVGDQAREKLGQAQELVQQNPGQAVATAFGIGLVAGVVVGLALRAK